MERKVTIARAFCELQMLHKKLVYGIAKDFALSPQQMTLLYHLEPDSNMPMSHMAEKMDCELANVTGIVDKLEARDLLQRTRVADRRVKVLVLTPQGKQLRADLLEKLQRPAAWIDSLNHEEQGQFAEYLQRCIVAIRPKSEGI